MTFSLTNKELLLATAIAVLGFFMYSPSVIRWLDAIPLWQGYVFYQVIYFVSLYFLSKQGLVLFGIKITSVKQTLGLFLITTAFLMTISWCSGYVQFILRGNQDVSGVYLQTDDGLSWYYVTNYITKDIESCKTDDNCMPRIVAFVIVPFVIALLGGYLITGKIKM